MWKDGETDLTTLAVAFRNSTNEPKNAQPNPIAPALEIPFAKREPSLHVDTEHCPFLFSF